MITGNYFTALLCITFLVTGIYIGNYGGRNPNPPSCKQELLNLNNDQAETVEVRSVYSTSNNICEKVFVRYIPSPFEQYWVDNIQNYLNNTCEAIVKPDLIKKFKIWYDITDNIPQENGTCGRMRKAAENDMTGTFSFFEYMYICKDPKHSLHHQVTREAIEPLAGYVRESRPLCKKMFREGGMNMVTDLADRRFILFKSMLCNNRDVDTYPPSGPRLIILDMGSTTYLHSNSGPSQKYLVDLYRSQGFKKLHRLIAYEVKPYDPTKYFNIVPDDVLPHYQFFNTKCSGVPGDKHNPLTIIKAIAEPDDYVVLKLDVDQKDVELPIVQQIINDPSLHALIDEFMFEHHSTMPELKWAWGTAIEGSLTDTYRYFRSMRERGIRAHSWI
jgi:hypothetical protein